MANIFSSLINRKFTTPGSSMASERGAVMDQYKLLQQAKSDFARNKAVQAPTPSTQSMLQQAQADFARNKAMQTSKPSAPVTTPATVQPPPQTKTMAPPPVVPSNVPSNVQSPEMEKYNRDYAQSLVSSQARKEQQALNARAEAEKQAQEQYDVNKGTYTNAKGDLEKLMSGFRERIGQGEAKLAAQAEQNKQRALTTSGESQRQLAIDRRAGMNDLEKRYSALGTIDSYGTGSFQNATENKESDFQRLTAQNKMNAENALIDIDNKLFDARASIQERLATEESKYQDAVRQINTQLATNEVGKEQALRAASALFSQRTGEIKDEFESLSLAAQKEKATLAQTIQQSQMSDQKLRELFSGASPEFMRTGNPTTANDQFIIYKYPKEAEAYAKILADKNKATTGGNTNQNSNKALTMVNNILSKDTKNITGAMRTGNIPVLSTMTGAVNAQTDFDGLKALLALAERGQLKGSGAVSDFESKMLEKAALAGINQNLSDDEFRKRLTLLKQDLESGGATSKMNSGNVVVGPDGQEYQFID